MPFGVEGFEAAGAIAWLAVASLTGVKEDVTSE